MSRGPYWARVLEGRPSIHEMLARLREIEVMKILATSWWDLSTVKSQNWSKEKPEVVLSLLKEIMVCESQHACGVGNDAQRVE
jgi:hypothetical protein